MRQIAFVATASVAVLCANAAFADPPSTPTQTENGTRAEPPKTTNEPPLPSHVPGTEPGTEDDPLGGQAGSARSTEGAIAHPNEAAPGAANRVVVHFTGLRSDDGRVRCALFDSADGFPGHVSRAVATTRSEVHDRRATCTFTGIRPGVYAIIAYHDENGNSRFDRNWIGMPTEGHATSNDVKTVVTVPKFKDASFYYPGGDYEIPSKMMY